MYTYILYEMCPASAVASSLTDSLSAKGFYDNSNWLYDIRCCAPYRMCVSFSS